MSLCGLPALRTFLRDPLPTRADAAHRAIHNRVNRQSSSSGIRSRPNKKCLPRLLTPIMGGKNWAACPSLAPVTPTLVR